MKHVDIHDDNGLIEAPEARIVLGFTGPAAHHNLVCWFCQKDSAVYDMHPNWCFRPCWGCQEKYKLGEFKEKRWWKFWKKSPTTQKDKK